MRRLVLIAACTMGALGLAPGVAQAVDPCAFANAGPHKMEVDLASIPASSKVTLTRSGNLIVVLDANGAAVPCTNPDTPDVTNVSSIDVNDTTPNHDATVLISEQNGAFAPGFNTPPDPGAPEIDIAVSFGTGTADQLQVDSTDNADAILLGQSAGGVLGANLNTDSASPDADLTATNVDSAVVNGRKGDDDISAVGSAAIPAIANPLVLAPGALDLEGGNQNDHLRGGAGNDKLGGGTQDDDLDGGGGNDTMTGDEDNDSFEAEAGSDSMDGGTGVDNLTYAARTNPVTVTLDGLANDGGIEDAQADNAMPTIENVKGGSGADFITGSTVTNDLTGNAGNDTVDGSSGNDKISGSDGVDRLLGSSGNDKLFGGTGKDNLVGGSGNDQVTGNSGLDILLGKNGLDRLLAKDNEKDKKIDCGKGSNKNESATFDRKLDPKPKSC